MNGPEHFREGQRQQQEAYNNASTAQEEFFHLAQAQNHFLAALVAAVADHFHPDSLSWQEAIHQ
ncbi:hypothetical protein [Streptomyces chartreusis]|uniref:hypothetical protein n=1 Tax=Streptomyces chartreusis TaxID=1969 RepID=UPI00123C91E3|nr:hypothetical protein [Streptomyces chartreusis]QEV66201.1 hypothetical protein CP983_05685 [Streptomyces chartreusis]GGW98624.1 hypothetical protein GCM10010321_11250 [Streptomyces chartreusis]